MNYNFKLFSPIILIVLLACNSQKNKELILNNFIEKAVLNESYDISKINEFIYVKKDSIKENTETYRLIQFNLRLLHHQLTNIESYKIITHKEFVLQNSFKNYTIDYKNLDNVYYIISENKLIAPLIINKNNKIVSFFSGKGKPLLIKNTRKVEPNNNIVPYLFIDNN